VWSLVIVIVNPLIQILLELFDGTIELAAEGLPKELIQDGAVEPLHKAVCPRGGDFRFSMRNIIELNKDLIGMDHRAPTVFSTIVGQDMLHLKALFPVEGKFERAE
jgi:hypothetical protein